MTLPDPITTPAAPDPNTVALQAIATAIENLAYQTETATLMAYLAMPYRPAAMQPIAIRLGLPDPLTPDGPTL